MTALLIDLRANARDYAAHLALGLLLGAMAAPAVLFAVSL